MHCWPALQSALDTHAEEALLENEERMLLKLLALEEELLLTLELEERELEDSEFEEDEDEEDEDDDEFAQAGVTGLMTMRKSGPSVQFWRPFGSQKANAISALHWDCPTGLKRSAMPFRRNFPFGKYAHLLGA